MTEKTTQEKFEDMQREIGNICFQMGKRYFEKKLLESQITDIEAKFHNLNLSAGKLHKEILKQAPPPPQNVTKLGDF